MWRPVVPLGKGNTTPTSPTPSPPIPHPADWLPGLCAGPLKAKTFKSRDAAWLAGVAGEWRVGDWGGGTGDDAPSTPATFTSS